MPVPSTIADLDIVAANNSPPGPEAVGNNADNYLRYHASFIAQLYAGETNVGAGIVKSDGNEFSPAVAGTDYQAPLTAWTNYAGIGTAFSATLASNQTTAGAILFGEDYDAGGNYNPATGIYTIPADGIYSFSSNVALEAVSGGPYSAIYVGLYKNNIYALSMGLHSISGITGYAYVNHSYQGEFVTGDEVKVIAISTLSPTGLRVNGNTGSNFGGHRIA